MQPAPRSHNLVIQPTPLVGRQSEVRAVCDLLCRPSVRLVTLTGPGGTGKTRVGLQVATELLGKFDDGITVVELAPIVDPALVVPTVAQILGVRDAGTRPILDNLKEHLRDEQLLLLLDNFEQVLPAASAIAELLGACLGLKVLVTSRAPLHLRGEHEYPVPPLPLPEPGRPLRADNLSKYPSADLFVQRATEARPDFMVTDEIAAIVAEICHRLDGLPLAIELAAARVKLFQPRALLDRLEHRLPLLTGGPRDAPERQRTLRDTIAWSYDLLDAAEQHALRALSVFVGGCTLAAAEAVVGDVADALDALSRLVAQSLVTVDLTGVETRYGMLETIREYGQEQLEARGEGPEARRRHAAYFLALAEQAEPELWESKQVAWLDRLEVDHDNFRAALTWTLGDGGDAMSALRIATALAEFWETRGHLAEIECLEAALEASLCEPSDVAAIRMRGMALHRLADAIRFRNDPLRPVALCEESVALFRSIDDQMGLAVALSQLGFMLRATGEFRRARASAEQGLVLAREVNVPRHLAWSLHVLASVLWFEHFYESAKELGHGNYGLAPGEDSARSKDGTLALSLLEESLAIFREHGDLRRVAITLAGGGALGAWNLVFGNLARNEAVYAESLVLNQRVGSMRELANSIRLLALMASLTGDHLRAGRLLGAYEATLESTRTQLRPYAASFIDRTEVAMRDRADDAEVFAAAWEEGRGLTLEQAVAYALRHEDPFSNAASSTTELASSVPLVATFAQRAASALTPREREVAALVGKGYSNRRIAEQLVIAEKTAEVHARNVREKLGLNSRAQIAAWAAQHGLLPPDESL